MQEESVIVREAPLAPQKAAGNRFAIIGRIMAALDVRLPAEFLRKLDIEEFLDQRGQMGGLDAGERHHLSEVMRVANCVVPASPKAAHPEASSDRRDPAKARRREGPLSAHERTIFQDYQQRADAEPVAFGKFALGNILVAKGEITHDQLGTALRRQAETGRRLGEELVQTGQASASQIEGGLLLQRKLVACALAIVAGLAPLPGLVSVAAAAEQSASIPVTVNVIANAKLISTYQATQITVTPADVARGYIDVPAASRFTVATNSRTGYLLEFHPVGNLIDSVQVGGLGAAVQFDGAGGTIVQRGPPVPDLTQELRFRFALNHEVLPGTYPWPLRLTVRALY
jgi:hypothetical protein